MSKTKILTIHHTELWKEYKKFIEINKLNETGVVYFVYSENMYNKECYNYNSNITDEECCMYNWTVDDDCNGILVDNEYGTLYTKIKNDIIGFRCTNECLKSKNHRFLNQWIVDKNKIPKCLE
jgi:hypothetical protein